MLETSILPKDIKMETIHICDLCGEKIFIEWDKSRSNTLMQCTNCMLVFTSPRIANIKDKDKALYSKNYFQQKSRMVKKQIKARETTYNLEIEDLKKFVSGGKILDVGCGTGVFLNNFGKEWEKHGCDISSYALEQAQCNHITTYQGEFEKVDFNNCKFDVVYFRASLHHTFSARQSLKKAYDVLKPGGLIAICMSNNHSGIAGQLFKGHVKSYEQAHNYLFSRATLKAYLKNAGFNLQKINYPYWGSGYESYSDVIDFVGLYAKYIYLKSFSKLNKATTFDFSSPPFHGNYINLYALKPK